LHFEFYDYIMNNPPTIWRKTKELHKYIGKKGKIVVATKIFVAPEGFEHEVPYTVAIIEFEDASRKPLQVVDLTDELEPGQQVICVIRRIGKVEASGLISYGVKAKPL